MASNLNAGASEFVPGRFNRNIQQLPLPPQQTEAPLLPPTISLNIGGTKSTSVTPPPPSSAPQLTSQTTPTPPKIAVPKPQTTLRIETAGTASKSFSTEKAKTDTSTVASDVKNAADLAVIEDLYGDRASILIQSSPFSLVYDIGSQTLRNISTLSLLVTSMLARALWAEISSLSPAWWTNGLWKNMKKRPKRLAESRGISVGLLILLLKSEAKAKP